MNCPYCSIHSLRGTVGLRAHIRYSHKDMMKPPARDPGDITHAVIIARAEDHERKARELRQAAEILVSENIIG